MKPMLPNRHRRRAPHRVLAPMLALGLALGPGPVLAQTPFQQLDADGSGAISRAEFLILRQEMFTRIDADGSGTLTRAEIESARQALPKQSHGARQMRADDRIWSQDANGDGLLTLAEYTAQTRGFDFADRNRDGALSPAEFERIARFIQQARG